MTKTVIFVGVENRGNFTPLGTAFVMAVEREIGKFCFLVTAKHVVDTIHGEHVYIRLNLKTGSSKTIAIEKSQFIGSDNKGDDLALANISWSLDPYDIFIYNASRKQREDILKEVGGISIGDETVAVGLYTSHYGDVKNCPIVRIGHIAALPDEPLKTATGHCEGYIVEMFSIGGLSGSPVFLNVPPIRIVDGQLRYGSNCVPLGILLGHHLIRSPLDHVPVAEFQIPISDQISSETNSMAELNSALCVVVPIERVFEIFDRDDLQSAMDEGDKRWIENQRD